MTHQYLTGLRPAAWIAGLAFALTACTSLQDIPAERVASARLNLANGVPAGTAQLLGSGDRLTVTVLATGISEGAHGLHLHETGACRQPDFTSAGGHLNPRNNDHGALSEDGAHLGDLPNLIVDANGTGTITAEIDAPRAQALEWLFDEDGTAVVIHAAADDYRTDPAGAAGPRIACGVLTMG